MKSLALNCGWSEWKKKSLNTDNKKANILRALVLSSLSLVLFDYALTKVYVINILNSY